MADEERRLHITRGGAVKALLLGGTGLAAMGAFREVWMEGIRSGEELSQRELTEQELLRIFGTTFNPEKFWPDAKLVGAPAIANEIVHLPRLESPLGRDVSVELLWTSSSSRAARQAVSPEAETVVNRQKPHLPRILPILNTQALSPLAPHGQLAEQGFYPVLPASMRLDESFRKQEVFRLITRERIATEDVSSDCEINWVALSKLGSFSLGSLPDTISYSLTPRDNVWGEIPVSFSAIFGTLFIPEQILIREANPADSSPPPQSPPGPDYNPWLNA